MWYITVKATNEQMRKTNKQKLVDTDNSMVVVTRRKEGGWQRVKGVKYMVTDGDLTLGDGHIIYTDIYRYIYSNIQMI